MSPFSSSTLLYVHADQESGHRRSMKRVFCWTQMVSLTLGESLGWKLDTLSIQMTGNSIWHDNMMIAVAEKLLLFQRVDLSSYAMNDPWNSSFLLVMSGLGYQLAFGDRFLLPLNPVNLPTRNDWGTLYTLLLQPLGSRPILRSLLLLKCSSRLELILLDVALIVADSHRDAAALWLPSGDDSQRHVHNSSVSACLFWCYFWIFCVHRWRIQLQILMRHRVMKRTIHICYCRRRSRRYSSDHSVMLRDPIHTNEDDICEELRVKNSLD